MWVRPTQPTTPRSTAHRRKDDDSRTRPPVEPGARANAAAVIRYAIARMNVTHPSAAGVLESSQAAPSTGRAHSSSTGRDTARSLRKRHTPRSRKKTCASRARFRAKRSQAAADPARTGRSASQADADQEESPGGDPVEERRAAELAVQQQEDDEEQDRACGLNQQSEQLGVHRRLFATVYVTSGPPGPVGAGPCVQFVAMDATIACVAPGPGTGPGRGGTAARPIAAGPRRGDSRSPDTSARRIPPAGSSCVRRDAPSRPTSRFSPGLPSASSGPRRPAVSATRLAASGRTRRRAGRRPRCPAGPGRAREGSRRRFCSRGPWVPARVRAALRASPPRDWIVESARLVRLPGRTRSALARRANPLVGTRPRVGDRPRGDTGARAGARPMEGPAPEGHEGLDPRRVRGGTTRYGLRQTPASTKIFSSAASIAPRRASAARMSSASSGGTAFL